MIQTQWTFISHSHHSPNITGCLVRFLGMQDPPILGLLLSLEAHHLILQPVRKETVGERQLLH